MEALNWFFENFTIWCLGVVLLGVVSVLPYPRMIDMVLMLIKYKSLKKVFREIGNEHEDYRVHRCGNSLLGDFISLICTLSLVICLASKIFYNPAEGIIVLAIFIMFIVFFVKLRSK